MNHCARCNAPTASDGTLNINGRLVQLGVLCDKCADLRERERVEADSAETWRALYRAGLVSRETAALYPHGLADLTESQAHALEQVTRAGVVIQGLWAHGPAGCGKTALCRTLLVRCHIAGGDVAEVSARRLLRDGDRNPLWERLLTADVLLVDDLDKAVWTEISASVWWEVTDRRADRPTLITANSSGADLAKTLTGAGLSDNWIRPALSRLMPIVGVKMTGEDLRKKDKEKT
jgi:DNA replication protein DnaC